MRRVVRLLLVAFAFAVPWAYSVDMGEPYGNIARIIGLLALAAALSAILLAGRVRTPEALHWLTLCLFLWFCFTAFWTIDQHATLIRLRAFFQVMMPVWLLGEFIETPLDLGSLVRAYVGGAWVLAALTIASFSSADLGTQIRFAAGGQDPNDVARFLDLGFPLAALIIDGRWRWPWKVMAAGYLPVGLIAVLLTASRGGFLAAVVALTGCAYLLLIRHARMLLGGAVSLPVIAAAFWLLVPHATVERIATLPKQLQHGDLNQRLEIWAAGWQAFVHAPFLGSGAGTFVQAARLAPIDTAHNTLLAIAVEGGVIGLVLVTAIFAVSARSVLVLRGSLRIAFATAFLVWLVGSFAATVEGNRTTWLLLGMLPAACRLSRRDPERMAQCFPDMDRKSPCELAQDMP